MRVNTSFIREMDGDEYRTYPYKCNAEGFTAEFEQAMIGPIRKGTPPTIKTVDGKFGCDKCDAAFTRKHDADTHWRGHEQGRAWKCLFCGKRMLTRRLCGDHIRGRDHLQIEWQCKECGRSFTNRMGPSRCCKAKSAERSTLSKNRHDRRKSTKTRKGR